MPQLGVRIGIGFVLLGKKNSHAKLKMLVNSKVGEGGLGPTQPLHGFAITGQATKQPYQMV